jgi:hypothetical protein
MWPHGLLGLWQPLAFVAGVRLLLWWRPWRWLGRVLRRG